MIEGAIDYLSRLPMLHDYSDCAGHSNSGRFSYYLFTHTHKLAAMSLDASSPHLIGASSSASKV